MSLQTLTVLSRILSGLGIVFAMYGIYFVVIALFGIRKRPAAPSAAPATKFAVLIAARNEQRVIAQMIHSLQSQNYPKELYDIIIAPNNCTDDTRGIAVQSGADIFDPVGQISNKGQVLHQFIEGPFKEKGYDALVVFDADNIIHPDFLQRMNNARLAGYELATGFRDSKNLTESPISTCYSVIYWILNSFYNGGREALGLSSVIHGCGFMVTRDALKKTKGWNTVTLTEDFEFCAVAVQAGIRIRYVPEAVFYDEQPLTFLQSWKQRRRWSTGKIEGMEIHLGRLFKQAIVKRDVKALDMGITFMVPMVQLASAMVGAAASLLILYRAFFLHLMRGSHAVVLLLGTVLLMFLLCSVLAAYVVATNRGKIVEGTGKGIAYFAWFLFSWMPIDIISIFKRKKNWEVIPHTSNVNLGDIIEK